MSGGRITRGFGFSLNTQTGETTRWAAGDPASVAEHLDAARERMRAANVPTLEQICARLGPLPDAEVLGKVTGHPPGMLQRDAPGHYRAREACGPDGCADSVSCPRLSP